MFWQWRKSDSIQFILVSYKETVNTLFNQKWDLERICEKKCNHRKLNFVNIWTRPVMHGNVSHFTKSIETINGWNEKNWDKNTLTIVQLKRRNIQKKSWLRAQQGLLYRWTRVLNWSFSCFLVQPKKYLNNSFQLKDFLLKPFRQ